MSFFSNANSQKRRKLNDGSSDSVRYEESEEESVDEIVAVEQWLKGTVRLPQYLGIFIEEGYDDMDTIEHTLTDEDLLGIGIKKRGHRRKIMLFVQRLKQKNVNDNV